MIKNRIENFSLKTRTAQIFKRCGVSAIFFSILFFAVNLFGQTPPPVSQRTPPVPKSTPNVSSRPPIWKSAKRVENDSPTPAEKAVKTDVKVNVTLCVSEGNVRINGWERNEIRAFVKEGTKLGFKILERSRTTQNPIWVEILGFDPATDKRAGLDECLAGSLIEIDVPKGTVLNLKSRESEIRIESINKALIENVSGGIFLSKIADGITATAFEGDVTVQNSGGTMLLNSTTGNIFALDVEPNEFADSFKAKTRGGKITLQSIGHRDFEVFSAAGTVRFDGQFARSGRYSFGTHNGSILVTAPNETSCKVSATYGFGAFDSEISMSNVQKVPQRLTGTMGAGDCSLNLTTYSGAIRVRKQN